MSERVQAIIFRKQANCLSFFGPSRIAEDNTGKGPNSKDFEDKLNGENAHSSAGPSTQCSGGCKLHPNQAGDLEDNYMTLHHTI